MTTSQRRTKLTLDYHATKLINNVASLFDVSNENSNLSDLQIDIGNRTFYCHKLVLQLNSEYFFRNVLQYRPVALQSIHPDQFYDVLQFMYTGEVLVSTNNIESLLTAADILGMDDLKKVCLRFLEDSLNTGNCLLYGRLANQYGEMNLARKCQTHVTSHKKLNSVSSLMDASEEMMKVILSDDNMEVKSEVEVCEMLIKWIQVQTEAGHEVHPDQLLPLIRWSGISVEYVKSKLLQNTTLTSDPASITFLTKVITYLLSDSGVQFEGLQTFHRPSTGLENGLMIVGFHDDNITTSEVCCISLQHPRKVTTLSAIPTRMNFGSSAGLANNNVYIIGAGDAQCKEVWNLNVLSGWIKCADMLTGRMYLCTAVVDSMLYVLGGWVETDRTVLGSVECYNTKTNKWSSASQLIHAVRLAACVTYKNAIYVFGGLDKDNQEVALVQVYNPAQESCTLMDNPMPLACSLMRAVLWETSVILLGCYTCFIYNFETQTYQERHQFKTNVLYFALTLDSSTVYIAGGGTCKTNKDNEKIWICTDEIKSVSVLDIIQDKPADWKHHAKLTKPALIHSFINISLPSNIRLVI